MQQHVLKRDALAIAQRKLARRRHQQIEIVFPVQRHQPGTLIIIRCIQRNRQPWTNLLFSKIGNARHNARGRNRHPRLRQPNFLHQQPHRLDEVVIVQKRLAHPHENQINAVMLWRNPLIV